MSVPPPPSVTSAEVVKPLQRLCHVIKIPNFDGYGFNLHSEKTKPGQYIGKIDKNSPAELSGLKEGDRIIEVNGVNIGSETHKQVVKRIKAIENEVQLLVVSPNSEKETQNHASTVVKGKDIEQEAAEQLQSCAITIKSTPVIAPPINENVKMSSFLGPSTTSSSSMKTSFESSHKNEVKMNETIIISSVTTQTKSSLTKEDNYMNDEINNKNKNESSVNFSSEINNRDSDNNMVHSNKKNDEVHDKVVKEKIVNEKKTTTITTTDVVDNGKPLNNMPERSFQKPNIPMIPIIDDTAHNNFNNNRKPINFPELEQKEQEKQQQQMLQTKTQQNSNDNQTTTQKPAEQPKETEQQTSSPQNKLQLNLTAAEMRAKLLAKKKYNPKNDTVDLKKKFEIIQKL